MKALARGVIKGSNIFCAAEKFKKIKRNMRTHVHSHTECAVAITNNIAVLGGYYFRLFFLLFLLFYLTNLHTHLLLCT
jgi:hypothetical protein